MAGGLRPGRGEDGLGQPVALIASYLAFMKVSGDLGTTSEAAALMVVAIGLLSWEAMWVAAIGATVAVTALLRAKDALHAVAHRFSDEDVKTCVAALKLLLDRTRSG